MRNIKWKLQKQVFIVDVPLDTSRSDTLSAAFFQNAGPFSPFWKLILFLHGSNFLPVSSVTPPGRFEILTLLPDREKMMPFLNAAWRFVPGRFKCLSGGAGVACLLLVLLTSACVKRPFVPVSEGREYGNPKTPMLVSHLPESNQWALARTRHHNVLQKIICFNYPCRKMIGRRKVLKAISFEDYRKRIRKNAKKGAYKKTTPVVPTPKKQRADTVRKPILRSDTATVAQTAAPSVAPVLLKADSLITLNEFLFATNSYKLKEEHYSQLDLLADFLLARPALEVSVSGHTDNVGNERHNVTLSMRRAESVAQYLINQGVSDGQVIFEGFGSSQPISGNDTPEGRSKNRRVEILIRNPTKK